MKRMKLWGGRLWGFLLTVIILLSLALSIFNATPEVFAADPAAREDTYTVLRGTITSIHNKYGNVYTDIPTEAVYKAGYQIGDLISVTVGSITYQAPFVDSFSDVDRGGNLIISMDHVISLAINYGNFAVKNRITIGMPVTLAMAQKKGYLDQYQIRHLVRSEKRSDYASDEIFANFRAIKAGSIAAGRLYRSSHPADGQTRAPYTAALVKKAGIKTILNLTDNSEELAKNAGTEPYYQKLYASGNVIGLGMNLDFNSPDFTAKLKKGLQFMIAHQGPYLIHCSEGKDRAGMVSAVLEGLMGATINQIIEDYMASYINYFHITKEDQKYPIIAQIITNVLKDINYGKPVNDANLQAATETYLIKTVGLTPAEIDALKARLK